LGGAKFLDLEDQDKVAATVVPLKKPRPYLRRGLFAVIFWGWRDSRFCLGALAKTGGWTWFFGGEVVVDCW
jgi:hypothetical protein